MLCFNFTEKEVLERIKTSRTIHNCDCKKNNKNNKKTKKKLKKTTKKTLKLGLKIK